MSTRNTQFAQSAKAALLDKDIRNYGAKCDVITSNDGVATGSSTLFSSGAGFTSADQGKLINIIGAGGAISTPAAPTITTSGIAGSTTYTYIVTAVTEYGETVASSSGSTATGNATLASTNKNKISWTAVTGAMGYNVYRTVGGATTGKITSVPFEYGTYIYDTGIAADGTTAPVSTTAYSAHNTTISSVNSSGVAILSSPAVTSRNPATFRYGTDDTAAIQLALNGGNAIITGPQTGTSFIHGTTSGGAILTVYSNTKIALSPFFAIKADSGSTGAMIANRATFTANRVLTDVTATAGSKNISSASAAFTSSDVGRSVVLATAGRGNLVLCADIVTVTSETTATISEAAHYSVTNDTCSIYDRDSNISLEGGIWDRLNSAGTVLGTHQLLFRRLDHLDISNTRILSWGNPAIKYAISAGDVRYVNVEKIYFDVRSDGVHIVGPAKHITVRDITGSAGDDAVTATATDWDLVSVDVQGSIYDYTIDNVATECERAQVRLKSGANTTIEDVFISNIAGTGEYGLITSDVSEGAGYINNLFIDNVTTDARLTQVDLTPAAGGSVSVRNVGMHPGANLGTAAVSLLGGVWKDVIIDGLFNNGTTGKNYGVLCNSLTNVNNLTINNVKWFPNDVLSTMLSLDGTTTNVTLDGVSGSTYKNLIYQAATSVVDSLKVSNFTFSGDTSPAVVTNANIKICANNIHALGAGYPLFLQPAAGKAVVSGAGWTDTSTGGQGVVKSGTGTYSTTNRDLPYAAPTASSGSLSTGSTDLQGYVYAIPALTTVVTITFLSVFSNTPSVVVSPTAEGATLRVSAASTTGFTVTSDIYITGFNYLVFPLKNR